MACYPFKVVEYVPETTDSASFSLDIPEYLRVMFDYKVGQFINSYDQGAGKLKQNLPCQPRLIA
tara:strand:+ start:4781 stop:4972 length:192 start_codon:yes stop_codon:yes gene_type:complete